jgi:hypothetical protein
VGERVQIARVRKCEHNGDRVHGGCHGGGRAAGEAGVGRDLGWRRRRLWKDGRGGMVSRASTLQS